MIKIKPWALGPFELIKHAEGHRKSNSDFDRRMALVSYDNSIELSIITFLSLNPLQRGGIQFKKVDVEKWLGNFHTKIEFLEHFVVSECCQEMKVERDEIIYYHQLRNELYHSGNGFVPDERHISGIRAAAFWIFSTFFNANIDELLKEEFDDTLSPKGQITDLSSSTIFLETFVSMKKSLELLLESVNSGDSSSTKNLAGSWEKVVNTFSDELPQNSIENIREAEIVRDAIVEGKPISASDVEVERLSDELEKLSGYVDAKLRQHQIEIVDKAISATENALPPQGNRKAGVIWQTIGSGLSLSLISYILRASFHPRLRNSHFCILVDRLILINQFLHLFDQSDYQNLLPITTPSRKEELASILASNNYQIIVSTIQKFDESISSEQTCVFVGYDLHKFPQSVFEKFKNSTFILFSSTPYQADSNIANVFGNLVSSYSMKQAIVDENLLPIKINMRIHQEYASDLKKNPSFNQLPNELQEWIANDILQNFEIRQKIFRGKGVIVVPNRVSGYALIETIIRLNPEFVDKVKVLSVSNSPQERTMILEEFRHQSSPLSLIIVTANWLTGYDNPLIHSIYLLARISGVNLYQLVGRVSRLYPNKECGVVVDYLENDWNDLSDTFDQVEITI